MLDLQKYFQKDLFNGKDFLQKYGPAMEGVSKNEAFGNVSSVNGRIFLVAIFPYTNLNSEGSDIIKYRRIVGTGDNARTETTTTPPTKQEIADWEEKHLLWKRANSQLKGFMQLTLAHDLYIPLKDMTAAGAWTFMKENWGKPTLSTIYGDFFKAATFTINQNNPLGSIAKLRTYFNNNKNNNIRVPHPPSSKPGLTLDWDAMMVKYEQLNPQFASRLTVVKCGGTNTLLVQQQQRPCPPQRQQQRGQQQQQNNQQQRAPPSNQDKGQKKKQQHGKCGGNRPHGHSHFASVASTITPPFSSVTKCKDQVALNAIEQSLRAEIATEPNNLWAGYCPPSTWDETYPDLNYKAVSRLPSSLAKGSPPPATFKGFWDKLCDSTLAPPPPTKKKNPLNCPKALDAKSLDTEMTAAEVDWRRRQQR
ncbi:hypothetical protein PQX77_006708 [Marasmius sp. AFHP31]|nr:hypothetical protein PQX77_006708 [Marasmius sp. AFHP31]